MRSPLSQLPKNDSKGLIGYFQIDPNNVCYTPYIPQMKLLYPLPDNVERKALHSKLENLTQSLQRDVQKEAPTAHSPRERHFGFAGMPRNIYPNPIQEQIHKMKEKRKQAKPPHETEQSGAMEDRQEKPTQNMPRRQVHAYPSQLKTFEEPASATLEEENIAVVPAQFLSIYIDPFQARLIEDDVLIFYRKVWLNKKLYIQGFAMDLQKFYSWHMDLSFANSALPRFTVAKLGLDGHTLAGYGEPDLAAKADSLLFERSLGFPLNRFTWQVFAAFIPRQSARIYLYALTAAIILLGTLGLYLIYRTAASQVRLSQKRQDFVSAITHELKTPLTSIRMYGEMLQDGWTEDTEKKQEYYENITRESERLSRLIDNVLQLAQLEKGTYKLNLKTEDPADDCRQIGKELATVAQSRGFTLSQELAEELAPISYDADAIKQVLITLLDNSLKFAAQAADKTLQMRLFRNDHELIWSWADSGPGIPNAELKHVFQRFYRVENEMTRTTKGTGIGLAMAHMLVEAMGARIIAANRPGGGLEIRTIFPIVASN